MRGGVSCCLSSELFLIGSYFSDKSDEYYQNRYYLHDNWHVPKSTKMHVLDASLCP